MPCLFSVKWRMLLLSVSTADLQIIIDGERPEGHWAQLPQLASVRLVHPVSSRQLVAQTAKHLTLTEPLQHLRWPMETFSCEIPIDVRRFQFTLNTYPISYFNIQVLKDHQSNLKILCTDKVYLHFPRRKADRVYISELPFFKIQANFWNSCILCEHRS